MSKKYAWASAENIWKGRPSIYVRLPCTQKKEREKTIANLSILISSRCSVENTIFKKLSQRVTPMVDL